MIPETTNYMILGYAVVVILLVAVVAYLVLKARSLRAELETLEQEVLEQKQGQEPIPAEAPAGLNTAPRHT